MLINQFDKIAIISKRETSFEDEKTGKPRVFQYITGVDCTSGTCFSDLAISDDSPVSWEVVEENAVYNCSYVSSFVKGEKNATKTTSVKLVDRIGVLEIKLDKK